MILGWLDEAQRDGARLRPACKVLGLAPSTVQRWRARGGGDDNRHGPKAEPKNKLSDAEVAELLDVATSPKYRDLSPKQIVPLLMDDEERYIASESTFYRELKKADMLARRGRAKPPTARAPSELIATGPGQVWSWDITYLRAAVVGTFYYLYLFVDVWSRKVVAYSVEKVECTDLAADILEAACLEEGVMAGDLALHADNGSPMKGATLKATMERLGVLPSYSRPHVSDDNPFSESLFRTMKYRPDYPTKPFESLEEAQQWVEGFVAWYNNQHLHSSIGMVTPAQRHDGSDVAIRARRQAITADAARRHPTRWSGRSPRQWKAPLTVALNPTPDTRLRLRENPQAA